MTLISSHWGRHYSCSVQNRIKLPSRFADSTEKTAPGSSNSAHWPGLVPIGWFHRIKWSFHMVTIKRCSSSSSSYRLLNPFRKYMSFLYAPQNPACWNAWLRFNKLSRRFCRHVYQQSGEESFNWLFCMANLFGSLNIEAKADLCDCQ